MPPGRHPSCEENTQRTLLQHLMLTRDFTASNVDVQCGPCAGSCQCWCATLDSCVQETARTVYQCRSTPRRRRVISHTDGNYDPRPQIYPACHVKPRTTPPCYHKGTKTRSSHLPPAYRVRMHLRTCRGQACLDEEATFLSSLIFIYSDSGALRHCSRNHPAFFLTPHVPNTIVSEEDLRSRCLPR